MTDDLTALLLEQIEALAEGVAAVLDNQAQLTNKIMQQESSLSAIAVAVGMTYLATGSQNGLPVEVLEDAAFARFLDAYPIDGPPITGKQIMDEHLARLEEVDPAQLAAGFQALETDSTLSKVERIRNRQIELIARQRFGDLDALQKGRAASGTPLEPER